MQPQWKTVWLFLKQLQIKSLPDLAIPLLSIVWTECLCPLNTYVEALKLHIMVFDHQMPWDGALERLLWPDEDIRDPLMRRYTRKLSFFLSLSVSPAPPLPFSLPPFLPHKDTLNRWPSTSQEEFSLGSYFLHIDLGFLSLQNSEK